MRATRKRAARILLACIATCMLSTASLADQKAIEQQRPSAALMLGERIFQDTSLSADGKVSCASCHQPERTFSDGRRVAVGIRQLSGTRNTPSLATLGRSPSPAYFWDGRRPSLETAVMDPFVNSVEMGLPNRELLLSRLKNNPSYQPMFEAAFSSQGRMFGLAQVAQALSTYIRSIDKEESAYERYAAGKDKNALSAQAQRGLAIFESKGRCAECHLTKGTPPALTDHGFHRTGIGMSSVERDLPRLTMEVMQRSLTGEALGDRIATHEDEAQLGRFNVTQKVEDIGMFRTPSLRGVSRTAPYMHDGSVATLPEALEMEVYYRGLTSGRPLGLTAEEKTDLLEFLRQL